LTNISEKISTPTGSAPTFTCDYSTGSVFYISNPGTNNFTVNIINLPSTNDSTRTYVITLCYTSGGIVNYCNSVSVSTTTSPGSTNTPKTNGGSSNIAMNSGNFILQQLAYTYLNSTGIYLTSVNAFS